MVAIKQEAPPPGGYGPIDWEKPLKVKPFNGWLLLGSFLGLTGVSVWYWINVKRRHRNLVRREIQDARIAISPLFYAQMDRFLCKQWRANRDEEIELMKDIPRWKVGTLWGKPIYNNPKEIFMNPSPGELYAHAKPEEFRKRYDTKIYH